MRAGQDKRRAGDAIVTFRTCGTRRPNSLWIPRSDNSRRPEIPLPCRYEELYDG